ncbi:MAG TPA: hypothetical protein VFN21_03090 [Acidimicrobiales bacterium]|nr:hypothetical protein [Acidimicrobiales bacterium]
MRTTVSIDDHLLAEAKRRARAHDVTLGHIVDDALRHRFQSVAAPGESPALPVFEGTGVRPGIDFTSNRELYEILDADLPLDKLR